MRPFNPIILASVAVPHVIAGTIPCPPTGCRSAANVAMLAKMR